MGQSTPKLLLGSAFKRLKQPLELSPNFTVIPSEISQFPNEETQIRILGELSGSEVLILNSVLTNNNFMELALMADAAQRLGATKITAVTPWLGYTPQDKVFRTGEPLSSQVVIKMLESSGIDHFICVDLHSPLIEGMFSVKVTNISAHDVFSQAFKPIIRQKKEWMVVALDNGGFQRNKQLADTLGIEFVGFKKERDRNTGSIKMSSSGIELKNKKVISFDDFTSTGGTVVRAAELIHAAGASEFHCLITHIITPHVLEKIQHQYVSSLTTTNSTFLSEQAQGNEKIRVLDIWNHLLSKHLLLPLNQ